MANKFSHPRNIERRYAIDLRKVARVVGGIVASHTHGHIIPNSKGLTDALRTYSESLGPWAERLVDQMIRQVAVSNYRAFQSVTAKLGEGARAMMETTAIGAAAKALQHQQVELIKSLPIEAGERAQKLAQEAAVDGSRAGAVAAEIARTEAVTASRATLIARTEIAKANAALTEARATFVGATHYIWRTSEDGDVRDSHEKMANQVYAFASPPTLEDGMTGNPGEFPNCRCFAEPILPE